MVITLEKDFYPLAHHYLNHQVKKYSYISRGLDSMDNDTAWHRCKIDARLHSDTSIYIAFFASDRNTVNYHGEEWELDKFIRSTEITTQEKETMLASRWQQVITNGTDFLLHQARGRYLWFKVEHLAHDREHPVIHDIQVDFLVTPLTDYLPEIYQEDPRSYQLLNRFLSIFQSQLQDLDEGIADVNHYLDPDTVGSDFLQWLCSWFQIEHSAAWPEKKLRKLLQNAYSLYSIKGTRESIEKIVELYTGEKPFIVEYFSIEKFGSRLYEKLYGDNPYVFTVMVKEQLLPTWQQNQELQQIIACFKPVYTMLNLVVLRHYILLDSHVYLGINSLLSDSSSLVLNDKATIPYDTTLEGMEDS